MAKMDIVELTLIPVLTSNFQKRQNPACSNFERNLKAFGLSGSTIHSLCHIHVTILTQQCAGLPAD